MENTNSKPSSLYLVNGDVYEFIKRAGIFYNARGFFGMAHRANELLELIAAHGKETEQAVASDTGASHE